MLAVFGALAGARRINDAVRRGLRRPTGSSDGIVAARHGYARPRASRGGGRGPSRALPRLAATDRFWLVLAAADLGVSRAGGTVWELAAAGLPALLVPYPHATGDHQRANAEHFAAAGGAVIVDDASLDGDVLRARVADLRAAPGRLQGMRDGMLSSARPDAAGAVARELLRLAEGAGERRGASDRRRRRRHVGHRPRAAAATAARSRGAIARPRRSMSCAPRASMRARVTIPPTFTRTWR